ncbi:zinc finger protein 710 [Caerostris extrusa]|uniref:Zinc finger protein 710 n=1 Tax=Caerostris extrusa TaxID=172846 RepID=A0AAV4XER1_CAEEX|nr:zinc finger protein 710 [Caerostris extrusa]
MIFLVILKKKMMILSFLMAQLVVLVRAIPQQIARPVVIPLGGETPQSSSIISTPASTDQMWKFSSNKKPRGRHASLSRNDILLSECTFKPIAPRPEPGMKLLQTGSGENILVPESNDENSIMVDDGSISNTSGLDGSINYRELINDPNFSPQRRTQSVNLINLIQIFYRMPGTRGRGGAQGINEEGRVDQERKIN